jgi:hypothetical protein
MSTVIAVKAGLVTLFTATVASTVQVLYGPRGTLTKDDVVSVGKVEGEDLPANLSPSRKQDEVYTIEVIVSCGRRTTNQQTVDELALGIYSSLKDALRASSNETLGIAGVFWVRPTGNWSLAESDGPDSGADAATATVKFTIEVKARI